MRLGPLELEAVQRAAAHGAPELRVAFDRDWTPAPDRLATHLDRGDVEQLRDALEDWLAGRPLPR
jgi:hypothetical protein